METQTALEDVRQVTRFDQAAATELRRIREEARLPRARVCELVPGLSASSLQAVEEGRQRVALGLLMSLCEVYGVTPLAVLRRAKLIDSDALGVDVSLEGVLEADEALDSLARDAVVERYETAIRQTEVRRRARGR